MKLELIRGIFTEISTIGKLSIDGRYFCFTLEDCDRQRQKDGSIIPWTKELKVPGETTIPYGTYEVITNYSNRFKCVMPLIKDVPDFDGIRIHSGNYAGDTEGCPLIGYTKAENFVGLSRVAYIDFFERLTKALENEKVWLTISREV